MKLLLSYGTKALFYLAIVLGAVIFLTILAQALAIAFYAAAFLAAVCSVGYLYRRLNDDSNLSKNSGPS